MKYHLDKTSRSAVQKLTFRERMHECLLTDHVWVRGAPPYGNLCLVAHHNHLSKLPLRGVVVGRVDHKNDDQSNHDGQTFGESFWETLSNKTNDDRDDCCSNKYNVNLVVEVLHDELAERGDLGWWEHVGTKERSSLLDRLWVDASCLINPEILEKTLDASEFFLNELVASEWLVALLMQTVQLGDLHQVLYGPLVKVTAALEVFLLRSILLVEQWVVNFTHMIRIKIKVIEIC